MKVGKFEETSIDACVTNTNAMIKKAEASSRHYEDGEFKIKFGWGVPIWNGGPIHITSSYKSDERKNIGSFVNFDAYQAGVTFPKGKQLIEKGDRFHTNFDITAESVGKCVFKARSSYEISNVMDYTFGGEETIKLELDFKIVD